MLKIQTVRALPKRGSYGDSGERVDKLANNNLKKKSRDDRNRYIHIQYSQSILNKNAEIILQKKEHLFNKLFFKKTKFTCRKS